MHAMRIQFVFLQQTAEGRRTITEAEQGQLAGAGCSGMPASMTKGPPSCMLLVASVAASGATAEVV